MSFEQKYLKYKEKYINLKNQIGGDLCPVCRLEVVTNECKCKNVKINYQPSIGGDFSNFAKLGLTEEELSIVARGHSFDQYLRVEPAFLQEGVDFSFVHSPLQWAGPFQGGIVGRYTPAKLLKDISVFFTLNEKKLGKFKKGHIFTINQYGSTERSVQKKNIGSFILSEITK